MLNALRWRERGPSQSDDKAPKNTRCYACWSCCIIVKKPHLFTTRPSRRLAGYFDQGVDQGDAENASCGMRGTALH